MMRKIFKKKAEVWVSAILYTLIITSVIIMIIKIGGPIIDNMKDKTSVSNAKSTMISLDTVINEVANEGEGSQRIVPVEIKNGKITIKNDEISWELKTKTDVMESRSDQNFGNLKISSNSNVKTIETDTSYIMETSIEGDVFNLSIKKIGSETNFSSLNTSELIEGVWYKGEKLNGTFKFTINDDIDTETGNGYTMMIPSGDNNNLGKASVIAHINSTSVEFKEYELEFTLESFADFFTVEIKKIN